MIVNISELEKRNVELYMQHGNLDITMAHLKFTYTQWNICKIEHKKVWKNQEKAEGFVNVDV